MTTPTEGVTGLMRTADMWSQATTSDHYIAQMTQNRERFLDNIQTAEVAESDRERFAGSLLRLLVLTEDWCSDSVQFLPPLVKLAQELENVEIRFLRRDLHREFASAYVDRHGQQRIPVIIALNGSGGEIGYIVERPQRASEMMAAETQRFARENGHLDGVRRTYDRMPDETRAAVRANMAAWRAGMQPQFTRILFEDLAALVLHERAPLP